MRLPPHPTNGLRPLRSAVAGAWGVLALAVGPMAGQVVNTPHDFTPRGAEGGTATFGETCLPCHTLSGGFPMDQDTDTRPFAMYSSESLDMRINARPSDVSLACLSCHDGTLGQDLNMRPDRILGPDLRNDHPISLEYEPRRDPGFRSAAAVRRAGLKLFDDGDVTTIECPTCHNPHLETPAFLRVPNTRSSLCLICHIK